MKRFWQEITSSEFQWEQEALDYVRGELPDRDPYRAWSCFEFIDGSINEVDLLVLAPGGLFLVEIKSRPGALYGDAGTWHWRFDGRDFVDDNPFILANKKAKRLKSLLERQSACKKKRLPFLEALVFLSARNLQVKLDAHGGHGVAVRDDLTRDAAGGLPGIITTLRGDAASGGLGRRSAVDAAVARQLTRAMDQAGIRPAQRMRRVGDYLLEELLADTASYQDWRASHTALGNVTRRIRVYTTAGGPASTSRATVTRATVTRAAEREFRILEGIDHPGILRALEYKQHELGPALVFDHPKRAQRLDHYLSEHGAELTVETRLEILRQLAETLRFAHGRRLFHRAFSPHSVLVLDPRRKSPRLQVYNWQTGAREAHTSTSSGHSVAPTVHPDQLAEAGADAYMAPEVRLETSPDGAAADVFSLGAVAFHLFAGRPPADSFSELHRILQEHRGLRLSAAVDGAATSLDDLIAWATHPEVHHRLDSVDDFLRLLDDVEEELTRPDAETTADPEQAGKGDLLPGGFRVLRRLGQGGTAFVFLVEHQGEERVLKVARTPEKSAFLDDEADVLGKLRHHGVIELFDKVTVGDRTGLVMARAGSRTLAEELRRHGRLSLDLLERFGADLLQIVLWLEEKGIPHRDVKPDNLGIQAVGRSEAKHLVIFDFSLSRAPAEKVTLGTPPYLDPFLRAEGRRWDLAAERFAAAMTLYEMATGVLPVWGDGKSDPAFVETEARLHPESLYPAVREPLTAFFAKALARQVKERFDNAEDMLRAWRRAFEAAGEPTIPSTDDDETVDDALAAAQLDSQVIELGLSTRAFHALETLGVESVRQLLTTPLGRLKRMRGVGNKTRQELVEAVRVLRRRFPEAEGEPDNAETDAVPEPDAPATVERLVALILTSRQRIGTSKTDRAVRLFLGLEEEPGLGTWLTQSDVARILDVSRARVGQIVHHARERWSKLPVLTRLRADVAGLLDEHHGLMTLDELAEAVLAARGSDDDGPARNRRARAVTRAAIETELGLATPRWLPRRGDDRIVLARVAEADAEAAQARADYALRLGHAADELAELDPLPSPTAVVDELRAVRPPEDDAMLPPARLVRLAAACSRHAAASSRLEIYPRGLPAARALALAAGVAHGSARIKPEQLRDRVAQRYPEAEPLPDRPALDALLRDAGIDLRWDADVEAYVAPVLADLFSSTGTLSRMTDTPRPAPPEEALEAQDFEERLARAADRGDFLLLLTAPRHLERAAEQLERRFALRPLSFDELMLGALHQTAETLGVPWPVVLNADAAPPASRDGRNLRVLVERALPKVEQDLIAQEGTVLLTHPGLLARYERFDLLERLRERLARPHGDALHGLWVLLPSDGQSDLPRLDGKEVPVLTRGEWARIPPPWLSGAHLSERRSEVDE